MSADITLDQLRAAAKVEGRLLIYSANQDAEMEAKLALFKKNYPEIAAEYIRLPSSQVFTRFISEDKAGATQADLLTTASTALFQTNPELFKEISPSNLPGLKTNEPLIKPVNDRYVVYQSDIQLVTYNTGVVSDRDLAAHLPTWEGLADPFWKGRIALVDPRNSTNQLSFLLGLQKRYGDDWLKRFAANEPKLVGTASAASQQVAAGAYDILVPTVPAQSDAVRKQGAPLGLYLPKGFVHVPAQGAAVAAKAKNPNAALLFINWLISEEAQVLQCTLGGVPNIAIQNPACKTVLPATYDVGLDVIPSAQGAAVYKLVGIQP
ncbi:MAG TPA: extracellular solute-binding protein [Rhizobium sp.]